MKTLKSILSKESMFVALIAGLVLGLTVPVQATPMALSAVDSGRYRSDGQHAAGSTSIVAGFGRNNFFVFDLSGVTGTINSAELQVECSATCASGSGTYTLYDVLTSITDLTSDKNFPNAPGVLIYNDLGSGVSYGSIGVSDADNGTIVTIPLNSNALSELNSSTGLLAFGGSTGTQNFIFGNTSTGLRQLAIETVPEPTTLLLLGTGFAGLAAWRWKTGKKN